MPDVTEQLTAYFDSTVERVTAEDVLAGSAVRVQNGRLEGARARRLRPAWVLAAGFVATVVLIGGAVGVALLLEGDTAEVGTAPPPVGDAGDGLSGPWGLLIAAGVVLVLAAAGLALRSRREIVKEQTVQTLKRPEVEVSPRPRSPAMLIVLAVLLVVAVALAGWLFVENRSLQSDLDDGLWPAESELTAEEQRIFDVLGPEGRLISAFRAGDVDAMLELHRANAEWRGSGGFPLAGDVNRYRVDDGSLHAYLNDLIASGYNEGANHGGLTINGSVGTVVFEMAEGRGIYTHVFVFDSAGRISGMVFFVST